MGPILPKIENWLAPISLMAYDIKKEGITVEKRAMSKPYIYTSLGKASTLILIFDSTMNWKMIKTEDMIIT